MKTHKKTVKWLLALPLLLLSILAIALFKSSLVLALTFNAGDAKLNVKQGDPSTIVATIKNQTFDFVNTGATNDNLLRGSLPPDLQYSYAGSSLCTIDIQGLLRSGDSRYGFYSQNPEYAKSILKVTWSRVSNNKATASVRAFINSGNTSTSCNMVNYAGGFSQSLSYTVAAPPSGQGSEFTDSSFKASSFEFTDGATIKATLPSSKGDVTVEFKDRDPVDNNRNFASDNTVFCKSNTGTLDFDNNDQEKTTITVTARFWYFNSQGVCTQTSKLTFPAKNPDKIATKVLSWNQNEIDSVGTVSRPFNPKTISNAPSDIWYATTDSCSGYAVKLSSDNDGTLYKLNGAGSGGPGPFSNCSTSSRSVLIDGTRGQAAAIATGGNCTSGSDCSDEGVCLVAGGKCFVKKGDKCAGGSDCSNDGKCKVDNGDCTKNADGSDTSACITRSHTSLEWIMCPLLMTISKGVDYYTNAIENQLDFNVKDNLGVTCKAGTKDQCPKDSQPVYVAWSVFRNIATGLLIIVMLVMVISQAFGEGIFDAYAVRKILPRLVIAVIAMQLSWQIAIYAIQLANDVGHDVGRLMAAPFGGTEALKLPALLHHLSSTSAAFASAATLSGAVIAGIILAGSGLILPIFLFIIFLVLIATLVGFFALLLRTLLIVLLVISAPIAFVLWLLPGTQAYWKKWYDNFIKILLVFPIMIAIIYAGRIFAWIAGGLGSPGPLDFIMVLVGFFAPLFMLFKAFEWGGSWMSAGFKAVSENKALKKGKEVGSRELGDFVKRRRDFWGSEYTTQDPFGTRVRNSLRGGRIIPTRRARDVMIARGNEFKSKENELVKAAAERAREKEFSRTGDQMAGKNMDLDTINKKSAEAARHAAKGNTFKQKDAERQVKEAMRDLVATGSTLELNNEKITDTDGKKKFAWQTKMWADLLHGNPELYRQVKGEAPDWVPHRNPQGLPKYRGAAWDATYNNGEGRYRPEVEAAQREKMVERGLSDAEIERQMDKNKAEARFNATAGGATEHIDDVQGAAALHETVTELDAQNVQRLHPTYFERIGDAARKGEEIRIKAEADLANGAIDEQKHTALIEVSKHMKRPAVEFKGFVKELAKDQPGRNVLSHLKGGADTMEHLDAALQYSGDPLVNSTPGRSWAEGEKGKGSFDALYDAGERDEGRRRQEAQSGAATAAVAPAPAAEPAPATPAPATRPRATAAPAAPAAAATAGGDRLGLRTGALGGAVSAAGAGEAQTGAGGLREFRRLSEAMAENTAATQKLAREVSRRHGEEPTTRVSGSEGVIRIVREPAYQPGDVFKPVEGTNRGIVMPQERRTRPSTGGGGEAPPEPPPTA